MDDRRVTRRRVAHPRLPWVIFGGASTLVLVACVVAAMATGSRANVGLTLFGGLIVVGIAGALMHSIVSPLPDHGGGRSMVRGPHGGPAGGGFDGGGPGGGHGGGDYGGGSGD